MPGIAIGPTPIEVLRAHWERQLVEKRRAGSLYQDGGYMFCGENGLPFRPTYLKVRFETLWTRVSIDAARAETDGVRPP